MEALGLNWMGRKIMGGAAIVDTAFQNMFTSAGFYGKLHAAKEALKDGKLTLNGEVQEWQYDKKVAAECLDELYPSSDEGGAFEAGYGDVGYGSTDSEYEEEYARLVAMQNADGSGYLDNRLPTWARGSTKPMSQNRRNDTLHREEDIIGKGLEDRVYDNRDADDGGGYMTQSDGEGNSRKEDEVGGSDVTEREDPDDPFVYTGGSGRAGSGDASDARSAADYDSECEYESDDPVDSVAEAVMADVLAELVAEGGIFTDLDDDDDEEEEEAFL